MKIEGQTIVQEYRLTTEKDGDAEREGEKEKEKATQRSTQARVPAEFLDRIQVPVTGSWSSVAAITLHQLLDCALNLLDASLFRPPIHRTER